MDIPFKKTQPNERFDLKKCKELLKKEGDKISDEELEKLRDYLYDLAELDYKNYIKIRSNEESNSICKGINRGAG